MDELISDMLILRASELLGMDLTELLKGRTFRYLYMQVDHSILIHFYRCRELRDALPEEMLE